MRNGVFAPVAAGVLSVLMTGIARAAVPSPAPPSCPNADQYTEAGTKCAQASGSNDVNSQVTFCQNAALEAGECAAAETGLAKIIEIGNEASFSKMTGVAMYAQSPGQNSAVAIDWLRVAMALYRKLTLDPDAPADVRAAANKYLGVISRLPWYVDGPPPSSPPGPAAPPP